MSRQSSSTCANVVATDPVSTSTSALRPRTATGAALLLDRVGTGRNDDRTHGRAARRPRRCPRIWPKNRGPATALSCAAPSAATSSGSRRCWLVAGGSGVVPLMAMIRARAATDSDAEMRLLFSSRSLNEVIYRGELEMAARGGLAVVHTLTRSQPADWTGYAGRVDAEIAGRDRAATGRAAARLHVRTDAVRRSGGRGTRAARARAAADQDGTLRTHGGLRWTR